MQGPGGGSEGGALRGEAVGMAAAPALQGWVDPGEGLQPPPDGDQGKLLNIKKKILIKKKSHDKVIFKCQVIEHVKKGNFFSLFHTFWA